MTAPASPPGPPLPCPPPSSHSREFPRHGLQLRPRGRCPSQDNSFTPKRARPPRRQATQDLGSRDREDRGPGRGRHSPVAAQGKQFLYSLAAILGGRHRGAPPLPSSSAAASRPDVRSGVAPALGLQRSARAGELVLRPIVPACRDTLPVLTHILRQTLTWSARSIWADPRLECTAGLCGSRAAHCMLGLAVLFLSCHPLFISAPPVATTALCTLALDRGRWEGCA